MRWNCYKWMTCGTVTAFCLICGISSAAVCASPKEEQTYSLENIQYINDGGATTLHINARQELEVTLNTKSLEEGYYTSFLYSKEENKVKEGQTIALSLATKKEVSMNINLVDKLGKTYSCEDETQVFLQEKGAEGYQLVTVENGTFTVPKEFQGDICIPVDAVVTKKQLESITTLSFIFVEAEGQESFFTIKKLGVVGADEEVSLLAAKGYRIAGEDKVIIPSVGEYIYQYQLSNKEGLIENSTISLLEEVEGIRLSQEGILMVSDRAKPQTVHVLVTLPDAGKLQFPVEVAASRYTELEEVPLDLIVPTKNEVAQYKDSLEQKKKAETIDFVLRMGLILSMAGYLVFYSKKIRQK